MNIFNKVSVSILAIVFLFGFSIESTLAAGPAGVNLGTAGNFVILTKTGISTTGTTSVVGDIGVSPAAATFITGFGLNLPAGGAFSTSSIVSGKVYAPGYADPTPANITTAVSNMETAYTDGMGRTNPTATELGAGNIGGLTLAPGLYKWGTGLTIPSNVTLSGGANDVWIFQIAQNLSVSSSVNVVLSGGAQASNVFWVVAGQTTIGTGAVFSGTILDQTAIVLNTGAILYGRALAQTAVTLDANTVIMPASVYVPPTPTPPPSNQPPSGQVNYGTPTLPNTTTIEGCSSMTRYSTVNGQLCANYTGTIPTPVVILGCNGNTGFSVVTGASCSGNTMISTTTYSFGLNILQQGSSGEAVKELQRFLNRASNSGLVVDGKFGPITLSVVKQWQSQNGLVADGVIGVKTKAKMNTTAY